jgi:hypothetical protein
VNKVFTSDYTNPMVSFAPADLGITLTGRKTFEYLDKVGIMHTGQAGFKHREKKAPLHVDCE